MKAKEFMRIYNKLEKIAMNSNAVKKELLKDNMSARMAGISLSDNVFNVSIELFYICESDDEIIVKIPVEKVINK